MSDIEQTPEFKEAVANAVKKEMEGLKDWVLEHLSEAREGAAADPGDTKWAEAMALAIAQLANQGVGRARPVAPEIIRQRADARERMVKLIAEAKAKGERPVYRLRNKVYLNEVLVEPIWIDPNHVQQQTEIEWDGVPNSAFIPVNEVAQRIFAAYSDSVGTVDKTYEREIAGVTAGGLVIKTGKNVVPNSPAMRPPVALKGEPEQGKPAIATVFANQLNVKHRGRGGQYVPKNILGTVAPPAQETV